MINNVMTSMDYEIYSIDYTVNEQNDIKIICEHLTSKSML